MIPFCDFGVGEKGVAAADDAGWETTGNGMVGWIKTFIVTRWVVFVLPVTALCCIKR
jgi:hypothetical protein